MPSRFTILPLLALLSMAAACLEARAEDKPVTRCAQMRLDQAPPQAIGHALRRIKLRDIDIGDQPVIIQPAMAGLRGPQLALLGRDVRLAVQSRQASPQELWHHAAWNSDSASGDCMAWPKRTWIRSFRRGWHWKGIIDTDLSIANTDPRILYRSRSVFEGLLVRPYGFTFGGAVSIPFATNTEALLNNEPAPVRRDVARFANGLGLERLYASWRATPLAGFHVAVSGGWLEEMYAGAGIEAVYRPFGSAFWLGGDAWRVWRRDPDTSFNARITDEDSFTGHVRAGYDFPGTRSSIAVAAGRYLADDTGVSLTYTHSLSDRVRVDAGLTWTDREEDEGFFPDTSLEPRFRITWTPGNNKHRDIRTTFRQLGRDGGQMLDRPLPLEDLTARFSAREMARLWPAMFD